MNVLSAQGISKRHGLKPLFDGLSFGIDDRDRIGLIGINGCGKSTLLQIVAGVEPPDSGLVVTRQGLRVEYLPQNPVFEAGLNVLEVIFSSAGKIGLLVRDYEAVCVQLGLHPHDAALLKRFEELSRQMDASSAWEYEVKARTVLGKLGVTDLEARVDQLSGGYRKRVALAHALLGDADLLILDEPTNHLDADSVAWLEDYLGRFSGAVLLVTHDRYFLGRVTQRIVELDGGQIRFYEGNFAYYLERKAEAEGSSIAQDAHRRSILRKELEWLSRGARARRTKSKDRIERIDRLREATGGSSRDALIFQIESKRLGGKIAELDKISKSFGARRVISNFSYTFKAGERLGIIGTNGSGKTTLANLIVGRCQPDSGNVSIGKTVEFGYFDQESSEFDPDERALDYVKREGGDMLRGTDGTFMSATLVMERFYFTSQMLYTPIAKLSGGERRRLYLVRTLMRNPNFLILDEPANDLDIPTLQALENFLDGFGGCLVVISHDRYFLDRTVDHLLAFHADGSLRTYPGDYSTYERMRDDLEPVSKPKTPTKAAPAKSAGSVKLTFKEQRELTHLEAEIPNMEQRLQELESEMVEAATDYQKLQVLSREQADLDSKLARAFERWAILSERG